MTSIIEKRDSKMIEIKPCMKLSDLLNKFTMKYHLNNINYDKPFSDYLYISDILKGDY